MADHENISTRFREYIVGKTVVFIDFDHTLFGSNSTELFISRCRPQWLASTIDFLIRECFPWRLIGLRYGSRVKDYTCFFTMITLMPWNLYIWRSVAPSLWREFGQAEFNVFLDGARRDGVVIVSFGMKMLIDALLRDSEWRNVPVIATPLLAGRKRLSVGKLQMVRSCYQSDVVHSAAFITDSDDDADLLGAVALGIRIEPLGEAFRSLERLYFPFRYTLRAKYPFSYFVDQTLFVDLAIAIIATSENWSLLLGNALIVTPLFLAFMMVYEIGYFENDFIGALREDSPSVTANAKRFKHYPIEANAWLWALAFAVGGALIDWRVHPETNRMPVIIALTWLSVLCVSRATFFLYNRSPISSRLFIYPLLQLLKYASILTVLAPAPMVGETLITSQIILMSTIYFIYRTGGGKPKLNNELLRTMIIGITLAVDAIGARTGLASSGFAFSLTLAWLLLRNCKPMVRRQAYRRRLDKFGQL